MDEIPSDLVPVDAAPDDLAPDDLAPISVPAKPRPAQSESAWDYTKETVKNVPKSALAFGKNIVNAAVHPIDTTVGLGNAIWGALEQALPDHVVASIPGSEAHQQAAKAIGEFYTNRYGSPQKAAEAFKTDPVGVLSDVSTVLGVGAGSLKMLNPEAAALVKPIEMASAVTNPMNIVKPIAKGVGNAATIAVGQLGTHTGADSLRHAYKAGQTGDKTFFANMRGDVPLETVVDSARQAVQNMRSAMKDQYRVLKNNPDPLAKIKVKMGALPKNSLGWADDTTRLDFNSIENAYAKALKTYSDKAGPKVGVEDVSSKMRVILDEWKAKAANDPSMLTVEGLDQLKQRLNGVYPTDLQNRTGRAFASEVVNNVKSSITTQVPQYKKAMHEYWRKSEQLDEIERTLSLGQRATTDTALRKLQSLMRNNVTSNYGHRQELAKQLAESGGIDIRPAIAGQALNTWTPRGLAGQIIGGAEAVGLTGAAAAGAHPIAGALLPTLAAQSPRLMGELYGGLGVASRYAPSPGAFNAISAIDRAIENSVPPSY